MYKAAEIMKRSIELFRAGSAAEAIRLIESAFTDSALATDPSALAVLARHAGVLCMQQGNPERALSFYQKALEFTPDNPVSLYRLADVYIALGKTEEARPYFRKCYEICLARNDQGYLELLELRRELWA